jgi:hypothetical protein
MSDQNAPKTGPNAGSDRAAGAVEQTTLPSILDCICWCCVTEAGTIIPWTCHTDREEAERQARLMHRKWRVEMVRIAPYEE